jgi:hypothetical protein
MNSLDHMTLPQRVYLRLRGISGIDILNEGEPESGKTHADLLKNMDTSLSQFRAAALDDSRSQVNYGKLGDSSTFRAYRQSIVNLSSFDLDTLATDEDRLAFWINLYNALVIHIVVDYRVQKSILSLRGAFDRAVYRVGGLLFSANDIEHGILRANRGHPLIPGPQFGRSDSRRRFMVSRFDPRIHFALNCAARSCPPIRWYTSDKISSQLDLATANFVNDGGLIIAESTKRVYISRIFLWYASDFGAPPFGLGDRSALIQYIIPFVQPESRKQWLIDNFGSLRVRFSTYDWSLNGTR